MNTTYIGTIQKEQQEAIKCLERCFIIASRMAHHLRHCGHDADSSSSLRDFEEFTEIYLSEKKWP